MIKFSSFLLAATLLATPAFAQHSSKSGSVSNSGARADSTSIAVVEMPGSSSSGSSGASGTNGTNGAGGDPTINYTGGYTVRNTPDVAVSSYAGAANACGVGGSLGISGPGFGIGGSLSTESKQCVKREWYKLMQITAEHRAAANDPTAANAFNQWAVGIACSVDMIKDSAPPGYCGKPSPIKLASNRPEWCSTISPATVAANRAYVAKYCE